MIEIRKKPGSYGEYALLMDGEIINDADVSIYVRDYNTKKFRVHSKEECFTRLSKLFFVELPLEISAISVYSKPELHPVLFDSATRTHTPDEFKLQYGISISTTSGKRRIPLKSTFKNFSD